MSDIPQTKTLTFSLRDGGATCCLIRSAVINPLGPSNSQTLAFATSLPRVAQKKLTSPIPFGVVKGIDNVECYGEFFLQRIKFFSEENVFFGDVGENEFEFCLVGFVRQRMGDELVKRRAATHLVDTNSKPGINWLTCRYLHQ